MANGPNICIVKNEDHLKIREVRPFRKKLCSILRHEPNIKCLILSTLICGCVSALLFWCFNTEITKVIIDFNSFPITKTEITGPCKDGGFVLPTAFIVMLYLVYLVECWHSKVRIHLSLPKVDANSVYRRIHEMRRSRPEYWWKAISFHYNRRTKQTARYRNGGTSYLSNEVFYERINSRIATGRFFYAFCGMRDVSAELIDLEKCPITKIKFSKCFVFANEDSANEFEEQRSRFLQIQDQYDDYLEVKEGLDLSNLHFRESLMAWSNPDDLPWYGRMCVFWIFSVLLLSWPLRIIVQFNTAHLNYKIVKLFGENYGSVYPSRRHPISAQTNRPRSATTTNPTGQRLRTEQILQIDEESQQDIDIDQVEENIPFLSHHNDNGNGTPSSTKKKNFSNNSMCTNNESRKQTPKIPRSITLFLPRPRRFSTTSYDPEDHTNDQEQFLNYAALDSYCSVTCKSDSSSFINLPSYSEALLFTQNQNSQNTINSSQNQGIWGRSGCPRLGSRRSSSIAQVQLQPPIPIHSTLITDTERSVGNSQLPTYLEALQTSRPLFLSTFAKIRRCLTERDIYNNSGSNFWLNNITPNFIMPFSYRTNPQLSNIEIVNHCSNSSNITTSTTDNSSSGNTANSNFETNSINTDENVPNTESREPEEST